MLPIRLYDCCNQTLKSCVDNVCYRSHSFDKFLCRGLRGLAVKLIEHCQKASLRMSGVIRSFFASADPFLQRLLLRQFTFSRLHPLGGRLARALTEKIAKIGECDRLSLVTVEAIPVMKVKGVLGEMHADPARRSLIFAGNPAHCYGKTGDLLKKATTSLGNDLDMSAPIPY